MEPSAAIAIIETDLRHLVGVVSSRKHGPDWLEERVDAALLETLRSRLEEEAKRRRPARVQTDLASYTHLYELRRIIEEDWQTFSEALGEKRAFVVLMDKVEDFRNAPAHSRELLPHERSLLEGIAGYVRTQVTTYLSAQSPDTRHYPVIESVRDSFGNQPAMRGAGDPTSLETGLILQVGAEVTFEARGWDPKGRELTWQFGLNWEPRGIATGSEAAFTWTVDEADVGRNCYFVVTLKSPGPYFRHTGYDQRVDMMYEVEPPS